MASHAASIKTRRGRLACDECHARKIKCDREERCTNCRKAKRECTHTRQGRPVRPRKSHLSVLENRLSELESLQRNLSEDVDRAPSGNEILQEVHQHNDSYIQSQHGSQGPNGDLSKSSEARAFIERELNGGGIMSIERHKVLGGALKIIDEISRDTTSSVDVLAHNIGSFSSKDIPTVPSPEFLYLMLHDTQDKTRWPDHISDKCFRDMIYALLQGTANEHILGHYRVSVYVKAVFAISQWRVPSNDGDPIRHIYKKSKEQYIAAACHGLASISLMSTPTLSLIQATISGAMLMQALGNVSQSWIFTAIAARYLVALNCHTWRDTTPLTEHELALRSCLSWCFCLDKILSMLLLRPPSLPQLMLKPMGLVQHFGSSHEAEIMETMIEIAQIQESVFELAANSTKSNTDHIRREFGCIMDSMDDLSQRIEHAKSKTSNVRRLHWIATDFTSKAVLINAHQTRLHWIQDSATRADCVACARNILDSLSCLHLQLEHNPKFAELYSTFQTWTSLLFPVGAFFGVFCHFVATSNSDDYFLLERAVLCLERAGTIESCAKIHKFLTEVLQLSRHLLLDAGETEKLPADLSSPQSNSKDSENVVSPGKSGIDQVCEQNVIDEEQTVWNDDLLHELLTIHPSLDWFEQRIV